MTDMGRKAVNGYQPDSTMRSERIWLNGNEPVGFRLMQRAFG